MPRTALSALALASAVVATAPAAARAAAPWSAPQPVLGSQQAGPFTVGLSLGRGDRGVIGYSVNPTPQLVGSPQTGGLAGYGPGGPLIPTQSIAAYDLAAPAVAYGETRSIVVQRRFLDRERKTTRLAVSLAKLPATTGSRQVLDSSVRLKDVAVATNGDGQAAVVWTEDKGYTRQRANNDRLYISLRKVGGRFGKPSVLVGSGKLAGVSVAYGTDGHLVVAFERQAIGRNGRPGPRRVQARYRGVRGHGFEPIDDLGVERGVTELVTQMTTDGRAYVAWGTQDGGIEANDPYEVYAATKPRTVSRFRDAVQLFRGRGSSVDRPRGRLSMALDRAGAEAVLAFTGVADGGPAVGTLRPVLVSTTDRGGTFGLPVLVPGGNGAVGGIVASPGGEATVVWTAHKPGFAEEATGVLASTRPAGGAFQTTPEVVSVTPPLSASVPALAQPLAGSAPVVAWYDQQATGILTSGRG